MFTLPPQKLVCSCLQGGVAKAPRNSSVGALLKLFGQRTSSGSSQEALADGGAASLLVKSIANLRSTLRKPEQQPECVSCLLGCSGAVTSPTGRQTCLQCKPCSMQLCLVLASPAVYDKQTVSTRQCLCCCPPLQVAGAGVSSEQPSAFG